MTKLCVTVFGGSVPKPGESAYQEAQRLGQLIGEYGYTVLTGGYMGTMEAVSRGVAEAGGHVIGVTCEEIEAWRNTGANTWVQEEMRFPTMRQRLHALIDNCDAAFALPGGIGTLAEIAEMWSNLQTGIIAPHPLILIGPGWRQIFETLFATHDAYIAQQYRGLISFAVDVESAFEQLQKLITRTYARDMRIEG